MRSRKEKVLLNLLLGTGIYLLDSMRGRMAGTAKSVWPEQVGVQHGFHANQRSQEDAMPQRESEQLCLFARRHAGRCRRHSNGLQADHLTHDSTRRIA